MKLTSKTKEDFLDYYWKNYIGKTRFLDQKSETEDFFNSLYPTFQNALIIEFFDSAGIFIGIVRFNVGSGYFESRIPYQGGIYFTSISRTEATNKAIEKANIIYNEYKL